MDSENSKIIDFNDININDGGSTHTFSSDPAPKDYSGLSDEEIKDPNKIQVTIADKDAPIVVLFGPPACGKTMTLVRLVRFLKKMKKYTVTPIRTFRPNTDKNYEWMCDNFNSMINSDQAQAGTDRMNFMLVKISEKGRTICQILEAPGEYYFNPKNPNAPFPRFFDHITSTNARKIWTIMVEPDWENEIDRLNYVDRISSRLKKRMTSKDKVIFVYNKIDKTDFLIDNSGSFYLEPARNDINKYLYPDIFKAFKNNNPITKIFTPYNLEFTVFQTGYYQETVDGERTFENGPDVYPRRLWEIILKKVRG